MLPVLGPGLVLRLFQPAADGWPFFPVQFFSGELPEGRRDHVRVPALEEHQVTGMLAGGVLLQSKIQAVLLRRGRKGLDVLVRDLDIGDAGIVLHQLPEGLFAETPQFQVTLIADSGVIPELYAPGSPTQTPSICAVKPAPMTLGLLQTAVTARGKWKLS